MTFSGKKSFILTLLLMACMLPAAPVPAQKTDPAKESEKHFALGVYYYKQGDYHVALAEFETSHRLNPHFSFHYNIGLCWMNIGDPAMALNEFSLFFIEGEDGIDEKKGEALQKASLELLKKVMIVRIEEMPAGALVYVDGAKNAMGSMQYDFYINSGKHTIEVIAGSMVLVSQTVDGVPGKTITIRIVKENSLEVPFVQEEQDNDLLPATEPPVRGKKKGESAITSWLWASAALSAVCLVAGGVTGGLAMNEESEMIDAEDFYEERLGLDSHEDMQSILDDINAHYERAKVLGYSSTATFTAGGALAAVSLALLIVKLTKKGESKEKNVKISIAPPSANQPSTVMLEWKFQ